MVATTVVGKLWRPKGGERGKCWVAGCPATATTTTCDVYCTASSTQFFYSSAGGGEVDVDMDCTVGPERGCWSQLVAVRAREGVVMRCQVVMKQDKFVVWPGKNASQRGPGILLVWGDGKEARRRGIGGGTRMQPCHPHAEFSRDEGRLGRRTALGEGRKGMRLRARGRRTRATERR